MKIKFKTTNGRLLLNDKKYIEMSPTERDLFGTFINYEKQKFQEKKLVDFLRNKIVNRKFTYQFLKC